MAKNNLSVALKPIKREPISVTILNMITDNILSGNLKPGDKLPTEIELAEHLGTKRKKMIMGCPMILSSPAWCPVPSVGYPQSGLMGFQISRPTANSRIFPSIHPM